MTAVATGWGLVFDDSPFATTVRERGLVGFGPPVPDAKLGPDEWLAELGKLPGIVVPRNGSGVWDFVWSLRQGITKGKATARVPPRRGLRQNSIDDFLQPELLKLVDWIEAELDQPPSPE